MNHSLKSFFLGLAILFALPWLMVVVYPWLVLSELDRVAYAAEDEVGDTFYPPVRAGQALGAQIYGRNGCAYCHTQMIRPTYAGADRWRPGWAGREDQDLARETLPRDYLGDSYAYLGLARIGPDLSNVGNRIQDADWHYRHLYDPRSVRPGSLMPAFRNLFEKRQVNGRVSQEAVGTVEEGGVLYELVPGNEARALVNYLVTMRKDHKLPGKLISSK